MNQRKTRPVPAFAHEGDVAKVARNPHKRPPVSLRVEFVAQVLDVARAVHERGLACRAHAHKAPAQKLTRPRNLDPSRSRYSFGEHRLPVRDYRLEALAQFRRHRVAREHLGRALVLLPLQRLCLDLQVFERIPEEQAARRDAEHHHRAVRIGDYLARAACEEIVVHGHVVAAQHRDDAFAGRAHRPQEVVNLLRRR